MSELHRCGLNDAKADTDAPVVLQLVGMDIQSRDFIGLKWDDGRRSNFHLLHLRSWCLCPECQHSTGQRLVNAADIAPSQDIDDIYRTLCLYSSAIAPI